MKRAPLLLALAATAALLWHSATPARACSCAYNDVTDLVATADTILIGVVENVRVLEVGEYDQPGNPVVTRRVRATVDVERYLNGTGPDTVAVEENSGGCGLLSVGSTGSEYMLLLTGKRSPFELNGICSGSVAIYNPYQPRPDDVPFLATITAEQYQALGPFVAITGSGVPPTTSNAPTIPLAVAAVAIPLVFVLAASFVFPAKGSRT